MGTSALAASRIWYITGATHAHGPGRARGRGRGRAFAETALHGGDRTARTAREVSPLEALTARHPGRRRTLALDVTDRATVFDVVAQVVQRLTPTDASHQTAAIQLPAVNKSEENLPPHVH